MIFTKPITTLVCLGLPLLLGLAGCSLFQPAAENGSAPSWRMPSEAELSQEIFPQHLAAAHTLPPTPSDPSPPRYLNHKVRFQGETLASIARWYTGDWHNWERLASVNPELRPDRIQMGVTIKIPEEIVTRRQPFPKTALPSQTKPRRLSAPVSTSTATSDVELSGPVDALSSVPKKEAAGLPQALQPLD